MVDCNFYPLAFGTAVSMLWKISRNLSHMIAFTRTVCDTIIARPSPWDGGKEKFDPNLVPSVDQVCGDNGSLHNLIGRKGPDNNRLCYKAPHWQNLIIRYRSPWFVFIRLRFDLSWWPFLITIIQIQQPWEAYNHHEPWWLAWLDPENPKRSKVISHLINFQTYQTFLDLPSHFEYFFLQLFSCFLIVPKEGSMSHRSNSQDPFCL